MKSKTESILNVLHILSWVAFIGLLIKAGTIVIFYLVYMGDPPASRDLYNGMDLSAYREFSFVHYTSLVGYKVILLLMQANIALLLTRLLSRLNISKPFTDDVAKLMQKISQSILGVWLVTMIYNIHVAILEKTFGLSANYISGEFIFLAGIVYVLAQLFKRGVEIQYENELTV